MGTQPQTFEHLAEIKTTTPAKQTFYLGGDADWQVKQTAAGTEVIQTKSILKDVNVITLGTFVAGAKEWSALVDESEADPNGVVAFGIAGEDKTFTLCGQNLTDRKEKSLRMLTWPVKNGIHIMWFFMKDGQPYRKEECPSELEQNINSKYQVAIAVSSRIAIRNLRVRDLPEQAPPFDDDAVDVART